LGNLVHALGEFGHLGVHVLDVILHLPHGVDGGDKLGVVLEDQGLYLLIVILYLTLKLVVVSDELRHRVLFEVVPNICLGLKSLAI
jgi:hypothetical protein